MKRKYFSLIAILGFSLIIVIALIINKSNIVHKPIFYEEPNVDVKVTDLINANSDKELILNKNFDNKFIYLSFKTENEEIDYYVDYESGELKDLNDFIKSDCQESLEAKIEELLYLKYPKFVVQAILEENVERINHLTDNELIIYFNNVNLEFEEETKLYLRVNFNEIKDFLDFMVEENGEYENENGYNYDKNKKTIAITFDDGPNGARTNEILNILDDNKAKATFFMVGNRMSSGANTILNVLNHNCEIGSHSYNHTSMKRQKLEEVIADEAKTEEIYKSITGQDLIYTRPPYGAVNADIKGVLTNYIINWDIDPEDWLHRDTEYVVNHILENVSDGDIVLLHDSYDTTVEAVREVLPKLYLKGYQVVSIGDLANITGRTLELNTIYRSFKRN